MTFSRVPNSLRAVRVIFALKAPMLRRVAVLAEHHVRAILVGTALDTETEGRVALPCVHYPLGAIRVRLALKAHMRRRVAVLAKSRRRAIDVIFTSNTAIIRLAAFSRIARASSTLAVVLTLKQARR